MFRINFSTCSGIFGVPNEVVDEHLKLSGALSLKVLLILLRHGRPMGADELASILNQTEGDVRDALNQWTQSGLVESTEHIGGAREQTGMDLKPEPVEQKEEPEKPQKKKAAKQTKKQLRGERFRRMTRQEVNECAMSDDNVGVIIDESQNILGRTLQSSECETLVSYYKNYGMQPDILMMLLHYCKSIGRSSLAQYEKFALDWINREIDTHEKVEKELLELSTQQDIEGELRKLLEIPDTLPVDVKPRHIDYYKSWQGMDQSLLKEACQRTINAIDTFSIDYMNTILIDWEQKGIKTAEQLKSKNYSSKNGKKKATPESSASYDLGKLEEMITHGSVWD